MNSSIPNKQQLSNYARVLLQVGLSAKQGDKIAISAPLFAADLVRHVAAEAYALGALDVRVDWTDTELDRARFLHGTQEAVSFFSQTSLAAAEAQLNEGYARLALRGDAPSAFADLDGAMLGKRAQGMAAHMQAVSRRISGGEVPWVVAAVPSEAWAKEVYPELDAAAGMAALWDDIFAVSRLNEGDAVAAWRAHTEALQRRCDALNALKIVSLHFQNDEGTDLTVGLVEGAVWEGGGARDRAGRFHVPNIPTDEVFTAPHLARVSGVAVSSRPLALGGRVVDGINATFEDGKIVRFTAEKGEEAFASLLATDEGASRLGEVALVAASAPVAQRGRLFFNTLYDENAASHIAQGACYPSNLPSPEVEGGNDSAVHVDWMIGSPSTSVTALLPSGERLELMRGGEWVGQFAQG